MPERTLRVCALYPDLMNIYADRGNLIMLQRRSQWRGIGFELLSADLETPLDPDGADLYYIGGGQDRDQKLCAEDLADRKREALHAAAARGAVILAVCGGYQLLGRSYQLGDETLPGVGLVDLHTVRSDGPRLIGNVAIEVELARAPPVITFSPALRTTADAPSWDPESPRSAASSRATATTTGTAWRACTPAMSWVPISTARCCPRTRGSPTG